MNIKSRFNPLAFTSLILLPVENVMSVNWLLLIRIPNPQFGLSNLSLTIQQGAINYPFDQFKKKPLKNPVVFHQ